MQKEYLAKNFLNRQHLESVIKIEVGDNIEDNKTARHTIKGNREEMKRLFLDETTSVFGCKCVVMGKTKVDELNEIVANKNKK